MLISHSIVFTISSKPYNYLSSFSGFNLKFDPNKALYILQLFWSQLLHNCKADEEAKEKQVSIK